MNKLILFVSVIFWLEETAYFGWNLAPQSDAELICDGISLLIFALAFVSSNVTISVK